MHRHQIDRFTEQLIGGEILIPQFQPALFDTAEVQHVIHNPAERAPGAVEAGNLLFLIRAERFTAQQFGEPQDRIQRRADFMGDGRQKAAFGFAGFVHLGHRLHQFTLNLMAARHFAEPRDQHGRKQKQRAGQKQDQQKHLAAGFRRQTTKTGLGQRRLAVLQQMDLLSELHRALAQGLQIVRGRRAEDGRAGQINQHLGLRT